MFYETGLDITMGKLNFYKISFNLTHLKVCGKKSNTF